MDGRKIILSALCLTCFVAVATCGGYEEVQAKMAKLTDQINDDPKKMTKIRQINKQINTLPNTDAMLILNEFAKKAKNKELRDVLLGFRQGLSENIRINLARSKHYWANTGSPVFVSNMVKCEKFFNMVYAPKYKSDNKAVKACAHNPTFITTMTERFEKAPIETKAAVGQSLEQIANLHLHPDDSQRVMSEMLTNVDDQSPPSEVRFVFAHIMDGMHKSMGRKFTFLGDIGPASRRSSSSSSSSSGSNLPIININPPNEGRASFNEFGLDGGLLPFFSQFFNFGQSINGTNNLPVDFPGMDGSYPIFGGRLLNGLDLQGVKGKLGNIINGGGLGDITNKLKSFGLRGLPGKFGREFGGPNDDDSDEYSDEYSDEDSDEYSDEDSDEEEGTNSKNPGPIKGVLDAASGIAGKTAGAAGGLANKAAGAAEGIANNVAGAAGGAAGAAAKSAGNAANAAGNAAKDATKYAGGR